MVNLLAQKLLASASYLYSELNYQAKELLSACRADNILATICGLISAGRFTAKLG